MSGHEYDNGYRAAYEVDARAAYQVELKKTKGNTSD
tara:strand:+ start:750 stop:857 length:108 start_codon:yes stop_codon:yes gene_type:complete